MTVSTTQTKVIYQGDGRTRQWAYTFPTMKEEHISVYVTTKDGQTRRVESDYQVDSREKNVIYPVLGDPLEMGEKIALMRKTPLIQDLDLVDNGGFFPENIEKYFDRSVLVEQELLEQLERAVKMPETASGNIDFTYEIIEARNRAEQAAGRAGVSEQNSSNHEARAEQEATRSTQEADRAKGEADKARQAADEAFVGGIRSVNGKGGNEIELSSEDIGAAEKNHGHEIEEITELEDRLLKAPNLEHRGMVWGVKSDGTMGWIQISDGYVGKIDFPTFIVRPNHVKLEGKELFRSDYPKLWAFAEENNLVVAEAEWRKIDATTKLQTNSGLFSSGNGTTTFRLPDHRGFFYRVLDEERGVDSEPERKIGIIQADAIRNITGHLNSGAGLQGVSGAFYNAGGTRGWGGSTGSFSATNFSASQVVPTASENRVRNLGFLATIQYQ